MISGVYPAILTIQNRSFIAIYNSPLLRTAIAQTRMMATETLQTNGHTNGTSNTPKITLYTNHGCPYAHRAHIALEELKLPFEEVIIDLEKPRDPWYLKINPRGLVPSIKYSNGTLQDEILTESQVVAQFLADSQPSHLAPPLTSPNGPLLRARMNFFIDTWNTKISPFIFALLKLDTMEEKESKGKEWVQAIEKEIEPLLRDAAPFFGGSKDLTLAEVHVAPFLLRIYAMSNGQLLPKSLKASLNSLPNFGKWANALMAKDSVLSIWDEPTIVSKTAERIEKMKAQAK